MKWEVRMMPNGRRKVCRRSYTPEEFRAEFWGAYVEVQRKLETPCWEWSKHRSEDGYGMFRYQGKGVERTHRISWELTYGPIPYGLMVCHHCDNPPCIRPDHLFLGTALTNRHDQ